MVLAPKSVSRFVSPKLLPEKPIQKIAGIVGPDMDVANGIDHGGSQTFTMWGEIAYQSGARLRYEIVRKSDEQRTTSGTQVWEKLIGDEPALIMIDEIRRLPPGREGNHRWLDQSSRTDGRLPDVA